MRDEAALLVAALILPIALDLALDYLVLWPVNHWLNPDPSHRRP